MKRTTSIWIALGAVLVITGRMALGLPHVVQEHYRWRNDDDKEASATWKAAEDTAVTGQVTNENIRLRFTISNGTGLEAAPDLELRLQWQTNRFGTFFDVPGSGSSGTFVMSETTYYTNNTTPTTEQLSGTGDFQAGLCVETASNQTTPIDVQGEHRIEVEYCFKGLANVNGGVPYYFQLTDAGTELDQYSVYPEITFVIRAAVDNDGETDLTASSATLRGEVTDTGGETPTVHICWGDNDGGTGSPGNWDTDVDLGTQSGAFSTPVSGLVAGNTYYYRCYATNSAGDSWSSLDTFSTPIPTVEHLNTSYTVAEDDGSIEVTLHLSNESGSDAEVNVGTVNGDAEAGFDYTATNITPITWTAGQTADKTIEVFIANDGANDDDEEFYVVLTSPTGCTIAGSPTTTVHIIDIDGAPTAQFQASSSAGAEGSTPVTIPVVLSHAYGSSDVDVTYSVAAGDAVEGDDFTIANASPLTISAGQTSSNIVVNIVDDGYESDETFTLTLTGIDLGSIGPGSNHTYTIQNDDAGWPLVDNWLGAAQVTASSATMRAELIALRADFSPDPSLALRS